MIGIADLLVGRMDAERRSGGDSHLYLRIAARSWVRRTRSQCRVGKIAWHRDDDGAEPRNFAHAPPSRCPAYSSLRRWRIAHPTASPDELDPTTQISGFWKLKLTNCAPVSDLRTFGLVASQSPAKARLAFGRRPHRLDRHRSRSRLSRWRSPCWRRRNPANAPMAPAPLQGQFIVRRLYFQRRGAPEPCISA
jgi:hypothetical protein